ncbi:MAG: hypothetical protein KBD04_05900 [Proteobacteria bacterium]|nr:hypothetical protein [Pseudomonadota bacterium]
MPRGQMQMPGFNMMSETAAFQLSMGGTGTTSRFAPGPGITQTRNPFATAISRSVPKRTPDFDEGFRAVNATINSFFSQMGGSDIKSRVIPVAITERMQHHAFQMQQFHAQEQYEREVEDFLATYEYACGLDP